MPGKDKDFKPVESGTESEEPKVSKLEAATLKVKLKEKKLKETNEAACEAHAELMAAQKDLATLGTAEGSEPLIPELKPEVNPLNP